MKPGYKTTEFWISISVILIASSIGILAVVYGKGIYEKASAGVALLIAYLKAHGYNAGRVKQKVEDIIKSQVGSDAPASTPTPTPVPTPLPTPAPLPPPPAPVVIMPDLSVTTRVTKAGETVITTHIGKAEDVSNP